jgi:DNA replication protein DnaC
MSANPFDIEWSEITVPCSTHGEQIVKRIVALGGKAFNQPDTPRCPVCTKEKAHAEQARNRQEEEAERVDRLVKASRIPLNYANYGFDDYTTDTAAQQRALDLCRRYATSITERKSSGWLVLTGRPGTGKTMLLGCMARTLAGAHIATRYVTQAAMGREFRATYQRNAEICEAALFDQYVEIPVLLLDELAVFSTEGTDRVLFELLDTRYSNGRPTVLVTNHPRNRLEDVLGERLYDRLREAATFLAFDWESARKPAGQRNKTAA